MNALRWRDVQRSQASAVALGNFDGVHLGHRQILDALVRESRLTGLAPLVITFDPHPRHYFKPEGKPSLLATPREKAEWLGQWPVEIMSLIFDRELAELEPEEFVDSFLKERLMGRRFLLGHDHRFGKQARGDSELLRSRVSDPDDGVRVLGPALLDGEIVSSSGIRGHLEAGRVERANLLLGRPFAYSGRVIRGEGRGRELGFPTANLDLNCPEKVIAAHGVYGGEALLSGKKYAAVANIGTAPTFDGNGVKIEIHLLQFDGDLYGQYLEFRLLFPVRNEKKFSSAPALRDQIGEDVKWVGERIRISKS